MSVEDWQILEALHEIRNELQTLNAPVNVNVLASDRLPTFPRWCESNFVAGRVLCHGIFNGMVDVNGSPQMGNPNAQPGPIALIEREDGYVQTIGVNWLRFVK